MSIRICTKRGDDSFDKGYIIDDLGDIPIRIDDSERQVIETAMQEGRCYLLSWYVYGSKDPIYQLLIPVEG